MFTVAKLVPLFLVAIAGTFYLLAGHKARRKLTGRRREQAHGSKAALLLVFAYGGFETALTPLSEAKNPRRDAVFALFTGADHLHVAVLGDPVGGGWAFCPIRRTANVLWRMWRGWLSVPVAPPSCRLVRWFRLYGYLSANILGVPRITFALAENGDFPAIFAAIHPRFRTPYVSILAFALLSWLLALLGSFTWNATLSAVARLLYYGLVCAALAGISPQAAGSRVVSPSWRNSVWRAGRRNLRGTDYRGEPGRIADPAGDRAGGAGQLAGGAQVAVSIKLKSRPRRRRSMLLRSGVTH